MRKKTLIILFLSTLLILIACRREEPEEVLPTLVPEVEMPSTEEEADETATTVPAMPDDDDDDVPAPTSPTATPVPAAPVVDLGLDPADFDWPPQLIYSSPLPGEEVLLNGAILLRFDQPMDKDSVEAAFSISPIDNSRSVSGSFTWPRPDTLLFTPSGQLQRRQLYRVNVDEMAASANGITLEVPLEIALQTSGGLEISQVIPADGTADVQTEGTITVLFNRPVVPLVSSGQQSQLPQPLSFDPPVAGSGEWTSTSIFRFVPTKPLAGATTYNVAVDDDLIDVTGETLAAPYSWRFATMNPDVVSFSIEDETAVAPTESVEIRFNMPMDRNSTETAVDFRALTGVRLAANFSWAENDRLLTVQPAATLDLDTNYRLRVGAGARAASGGASLEGSAELQFRTYPFPAVEDVVPPANSQAERWQRGVTIRFAGPMNWDTIQDRIVIEPEPVTVGTFVSEFSNEIHLDFPLQLNTEYRVTVPGDAADPYGNTLGRQVTWEFTTPDRPGIASFNLPPQISQMSNAFVSEVDIVHVNVSRMDAALYDLGLPLNLINRPYDAFDYRPAATPLATWNIPVDSPLSQESATKLSLANNGVLPNGVYLLTLDAPELEENSRFWQNQKHVLVVADTNIAIKQMVDDVHVWVTNLTNGQPVAGRNLRLYNEIGVPIGTAVSDANGFASFPYDLVDGYMTNITVISNAPGQAGFGVSSSGWDRSVSPWQFGLNATTSDEVAAIGYIYTDRPIYRPGDTMYYKGIVRDTNYGRYTLPTAQTLQMQINFISFFGGEDFEKTIPVAVSADGTFAGDFALPADMPLGSYQIFLQGRNVDAARQFTVAEYRTPEFIVSLTSEQSELLRGETVDVVLEASYLFGGAAADLQVEWNIYEEAHFLSVPGPYYAFGDNAGFNYETSGPLFGGFDGRTYLAGGSGATDAQGRLTITLPADLLQDLKVGSRDVTVEANVFDLTNFPVASRTTLTMHAAEIYVGVVPENYVTAAGANAAVAVKTVDWDGQRVRNQDVEVVFYRREWIPSRNQDYGLYYTSWEPQDTEVARAAVTTDSNGDGRVTFVPDSGGQYIAVATVTDRGGRELLSSTSLWVTDSSFVGWQLDPREKDMQLIADAQEYRPGQMAEILVQSPFAGPVRAWLTIERGTLLEQRLVTLNSSSDVLQIPITGAFAPNVYVSVVAIKPVEGTALADPYPDIRVGMVELVVAPEALTLDVTLTPQEDSYGPGETAVYDILVTDASGGPVQAELSLALVDLAVLTLKEDNAPPIVEAFYGRQPVRSKFGSGLIVSAHGLPLEVPLETLGLGGGGGDGFAESATARLGGDDEDIRADFPDTAFWTAAISTDAAGRATVEIPLPDNLTTWRLSSKAVTSDTLVGQSSVDIRTSLPLLVRPITPRFFTVGDVAQLGVVVNNNTSSAIEAEVSLDAAGVRLRDEATQTVAVPANGQTLIRWEVVALQSAYADLVFRVSGGGFSDASRPTLGEGPDNLIPIVAYTAEDIVATAGVLDEPGLRVEALLLPDGVDTSQGAIEIGFTGSLAGALLETITVNNDLDYSPSCPHALVNRVLPNVAFLELLDRLTVPELESQREASETLVSAGVSQLRDLALPDGGWGWCYSQESDAWISAQVVLALAKAEALGFNVDKGALNNGVVYLNGQIRPAANQFRPDDINQQAYYLYVLSVAAPSGQVVAGLDDLFSEQRALLTPDARAQMALAYQLNNAGSGTIDTLLSDVNNSAVVSATGTHWERESDYPSVYRDIISTAVVIQTLAALEPDNPLLPGAVRWQMAARSGALWSSSFGTTWSTLALTEWLVQSGELQGEFGYALDVNLQPFTTGEIDRSSIAETENISIPLSDLSATEANFFAFEHGAGDGRLYYTLRMDSHIGMQYVTAINRGIRLDRTYFAADCDPDEETCAPITRIAAGERVRVVLTVNVENDLLYAVIEDPLPAGAEGIDPGLATSVSDFGPGQESEYMRGYWGWWYFNRVEFRDDKVIFLASFLPAGTYQYTYYLDTFLPGSYQVRPTFGYEAFAPEVNGRAAGAIFIIEP